MTIRVAGLLLAIGIAGCIHWTPENNPPDRIVAAEKTKAFPGSWNEKPLDPKELAAAAAKKKLEEEAQREAKRKADEEAKRKADEEAKRKADDEAKRKLDEEAKRKLDEEANKKATDEARHVQAVGHFKQAEAFFNAKAYDEAIAEYQAGLALEAWPPALFNIAESYRLGGKRQQAIEFYRKYTDALPKGPRAADARRHIAELTKAGKP